MNWCFNFPSYSGQSLVEYAVGIVLVGCVAIGGLQLLGGNLNGLLGGVSNPVKGYQNTVLGPAKAQVASASIAPSATDVNIDPSTPLMGTPLDASSASNALLLQQVQPYNSNQVSGSNGVELIESYSSYIRAVIQALDESPNPDPQLRTMLTDLANTGHYIAEELPYILGPEGHLQYYDLPYQQNRYQARRTQTLNYLSEHPEVLSADLTVVVRMAADNTMAVLNDAAGNNANDEIHGSSNTICKSGGDTSSCVK